MKLLVIGHHIVVKEYQELWVQAARQFPEIQFAIVCPEVYCQIKPTQAEALDPDLVPVYPLPSPFAARGRQHLHFYLGLGRILDQFKPDYVYALEESNSLVTAQIARLCGQRKIPYAFWTSLNTLRIYRNMYHFWSIRRYLYDWVQRYVFGTCQGANATSPEAVGVLRQQGYAGPITCCGIHGVGENFLSIGRQRLMRTKLPTDHLKVGFVGRLDPWKGVDILIRAYACLPSRERVELYLYGDGPEWEDLHAIAEREGVADEIIWQREPIPYSQMPDLFAQWDVLVLPSLTRGGINEKFGRVLIEAMAAGAVAVGSNDGGIPKVLTPGGILFEPGNFQQLAEILDNLATDLATLRDIQVKGFEATDQRFSYQAIARRQIQGLRDELGFFQPHSEPPR